MLKPGVYTQGWDPDTTSYGYFPFKEDEDTVVIRFVIDEGRKAVQVELDTVTKQVRLRTVSGYPVIHPVSSNAFDVEVVTE